MIVFEWFYDKAKVIECELTKQEGYEVTIAYFIIMSIHGHVQLYSHSTLL